MVEETLRFRKPSDLPSVTMTPFTAQGGGSDHVHPADPPVRGAPVIPNEGRPTGCRATEAEESHRGRRNCTGGCVGVRRDFPAAIRVLGGTMTLFTGGGAILREGTCFCTPGDRSRLSGVSRLRGGVRGQGTAGRATIKKPWRESGDPVGMAKREGETNLSGGLAPTILSISTGPPFSPESPVPCS